MSFIRTILLMLSCATILLPQVPAQGLPRIEIIQDMDLGELLLEDLGGSVALTERNELKLFSGSVRAGSKSITQEARILLTGTPKAAFSLVIDPQNPILQSGRGGSVRVASFEYSPGALRGVFDDQGKAEVRLGARLDIPAGTPPGKDFQTQVRLILSVMDTPPHVVTGFLMIRCSLKPMLHLSSVCPLDFGAIIPGNSTGIFRVHSDGHTSVSGGGVRQYRGVPTAAKFVVTGTAGTEYCLELPKRVILRGPGSDMEVHSFEANVPLPGVLSRGGFTFSVGAGLTVPADQHPGPYEGIFQVTISYM